MKLNFRFLFLAFAMLVVAACARNPVTGEREFMLVSTEQEVAMGQQYDPVIVAQFGLYNEDEALLNFVKAKGQEMAAVSHRSELNYTFRIVDSPIVNAFAVPGGYVYFTRGIMAHFNSEAEFAGVLGHEIGHVTARHSAKQMSNQQLAQIGLIGGSIFSETVRNYGNVAAQGLQLLFLKNGRDAERQSDELGVEYSSRIGYDADEMADFFGTIARLQEQSGGAIPNFLSTHPDPGERQGRVKELATEWQQKLAGKNFVVNRNEYLQRIDGIIIGEDPRQGYVQSSKFYHPQLKFRFDVPNSWNVANSPSQVQIASPDQNAVVIMALAQANSLEAAAQNDIQQNNLNVISSDRIQINGNDAIAMLSEVQQQGANGQPGQALSVYSYFIDYGGNIYQFHGLSLRQNFSRYQNALKSVPLSFARLTDPSKLNVRPDRLDIVAAQSSTTLQEILRQYNVPADRYNEFSILNGMQLNDRVPAGMMVKVLQRN